MKKQKNKKANLIIRSNNINQNQNNNKPIYYLNLNNKIKKVMISSSNYKKNNMNNKQKS